MLSQAFRFHGHGSLRYVYKNGASIRSSLGTVRYVKNTRRTMPRCGVVVSKKVAKSAVVRNRIRRRVYEIIRTHLPDFLSPHDVVIIISTPMIATVDHGTLATLIKEQLVKAQILPSPGE